MAGIFDLISGLLMPPGMPGMGGGQGQKKQGGGMPGLPGMDMLSSFIPQLGGGGSGAGAMGAGGAGGGGGGLMGMFANPFMAIPAAAVGGATALSADSVAAGNEGGEPNWLGPLYNIPEALARGDIDDVMKDGAMGPVGAIYNIAKGDDVWKSIANSLGPLGQVPYLISQGQMPFSGGKTSKNFMSAFQGRGI